MRLAITCLLFYFAQVCRSEPILIELPGYAKRVLGGYGDFGTSLFEPRPFYSFRALYYAAAPTRETRFLPPVPSNYPYPDDEIVNARDPPPGCAQGGDNTLENCLSLSVYTPSFPGNYSDPATNYTNLLPVMVWYHGGSFEYGQSAIYQPNTFMSFDVVMVVVQYRLGPLGFLSLQNDDIPGNAGMLDQIEALNWIQKFIKYFGGDPNCVTIVGESAGGASTSFLLISPPARGLFHRAIAESGSMLADWALDRHPRETGLRIAELAGCPLEPESALVDCFRDMDVTTLRNAQKAYSNEDERSGGLGFGGQSPVIQKTGPVNALPDEPRALIDRGDYAIEVPILMGANEGEGIMAFDMMLGSYVKPNNLMDSYEFWKYDAVSVIIGALGIRDDTGALADALTDKYLGYAVEQGQMGNLTVMIPGLIDLCGTLFLKAGGWETVALHTQYNPDAYWYSFDFFGKVSLISADEILPRGVMHADEIMYLFTMPIPHNDTEKELSRKMLEVWTTFAKYGKPTPEGVTMMDGIPHWPPYDSRNKQFMSIDRHWTVRNDYTQYYTVTVDKQKPRSAADTATETEHKNRYWQERASYFANKEEASFHPKNLKFKLPKRFF